MTFNPILARVKVNLHAKTQGRRSSCLAVRAQTDRQTDNITFSADAGGKNLKIGAILFLCHNTVRATY